MIFHTKQCWHPCDSIGLLILVQRESIESGTALAIDKAYLVSVVSCWGPFNCINAYRQAGSDGLLVGIDRLSLASDRFHRRLVNYVIRHVGLIYIYKLQTQVSRCQHIAVNVLYPLYIVLTHCCKCGVSFVSCVSTLLYMCCIIIVI